MKMKAFADPHNTQEHGMDLRDYFASQAMQAYLSMIDSDDELIYMQDEIAHLAYLMADKMIVQRNQK
jgi:hypothetical protein